MKTWRENNLLRESRSFREAKIINRDLGWEEVTPEEIRSKFGEDLDKDSIDFIEDQINHQLRHVVVYPNTRYNKYRPKPKREDYLNKNYIRDALNVRIGFIADSSEKLNSYEKILQDIYEHSSILDEATYDNLMKCIETKRS